ncbi:hypothetical protein [Hymenobacter sp. BRD67]|uniref:hypothetical protein n=1 Tax=Hymenobacter sp. BRD67 TaxID=2675877 RepID=UPI001565805F|nr:hypothetical protein [Hymenobacter sp. BRD67]QKG51568.1 hypothetical protein GKZ67_01880 [Hymenobacter sp. BRD67]
MSSATDVLRAKTDAELQFFVDNPNFYHADLITNARQELRRRGIAPLRPAASEASVTTAYDESPASNRRPLVLGLVLLLLLAGVAGFFWKTHAPASSRSLGRQPDKLSPDSLKLESVVATPIPTFDNDRNVAQQLALVPAAERSSASAQALRQYKGLCQRFWRAQNPTIFLINQAGRQQSYQVYTAQLRLVQGQWNDLYKGLVYSYKLSPTMMDHLARMRVIARIQRMTLTKLEAAASNNMPLVLDGRTQLAQDTAQHLLAPLQHRAAPLSIHL